MKKKKPLNLPLLPPKISMEALVREIGRANHSLGQLNGLLRSLQNPDLLTTPLLTKEAVLSSRIEGTQASLEDVFNYEAASKESETDELERDVREILNYRKAMRNALVELRKKPIAENFVKKLHSVLLDSVRGSAKDRGNFRRVQVFIGRAGQSIDDATFIPPEANQIPKLMSNWESFIHTEESIDPLVITAIAHYQFEAIHPFLDGNGRIGRLLIPLILYERNLLSYPLLYISQFFEEHRRDYYDLLKGVSESEDWEAWIKFFLVAVRSQCDETQKTINKILSLYDEIKEKCLQISSPYAVKFTDLIFATPIFSFNSIRDQLGSKAHQTVYNLIEKFIALGVINEADDRKRNRRYEFPALLKILR